jgi:hypothetical protein
VTLSVGGNDAGFAQVLQDCVRLTGGCTKQARRNQIIAAAGGLEPQLVSTYQAIKQAAPKAAIIVLGYPQLFPKHFVRQAVCPKLAALYDPDTQSFMRSAADLLRSTIQTATAQAGVQFIDVEPAFAGHEICGRKGDWLEGLVLTHLRALSLAAIKDIKKINVKDYISYKSFHPSRAGQAAYASALRDYIAAKLAAGAPTTPEGLPLNPSPR